MPRKRTEISPRNKKERPPEYWAKVSISREDALSMLDQLARKKSKLRTDLERSKESALAALSAKGIEVNAAALPSRIRLPAPEKVAVLREQAVAVIARDRKPFGFVVLAVVFGAMPLVDGAD
jgi:hypothetical protein